LAFFFIFLKQMSLWSEYEFDASQEVLTRENANRFVLYPIEHQEVWDMYKKALQSQWVPEEIDTDQDMVDWEKLTEQEKKFIRTILAFFAASDGIVAENIVMNFSQEITIPEARNFYAIQNAIEVVHAETYSNLLCLYIKNEEERIKHVRGYRTMPCLQMKANWALKYMNASVPFPIRLAAFAIVEGLFFSGSFCAIFWLKSRGLLPGLTFSNELISRDEGLHCEFACLLFDMIQQRVPQHIVQSMVQEALECEESFIQAALPERLIGMNAEMMAQYLRFIADRILTQLKYEKLFHASNPFPFMTIASLDGKTNFFERKVGEYAKVSKKAEDADSEWYNLQATF
jgi:ribonucleoside-diphosphate reductase beta chain